MLARWLGQQLPLSPIAIKILHWVLNAAVFFLLIGASALTVDSFMRSNLHPRTVLAIWAETPEVRRGGELVITVLADIHAEICRGEVHRWLVSSTDNAPVWSAIEPTQAVKVAKGQMIRIRVGVPLDIAPGGYYYKSVVYDRRCDDPNRAFPPTTPSFVYFRVLE